MSKPINYDRTEFLRSSDVASRLGLSLRRVQMMLRAGLLPGTQVGRIWLIPRTALESHLRRLDQAACQNVQLPLDRAQPASLSEIGRK